MRLSNDKLKAELFRLIEQGTEILKRAQTLPRAMEGEELAQFSSWVMRLGEFVSSVYGEKSQRFSSYSKALATPGFYSIHSNWNAHVAQLLGLTKSIAHDFEHGLIPSAPSDSQPSTANLAEMNIKQLVELLKPAQLWALLSAVAVLIVGAFALGVWITNTTNTTKGKESPSSPAIRLAQQSAEERIPIGLSCTRVQTFFVETGSTNSAAARLEGYNSTTESVTNVWPCKPFLRDGKAGVGITIEFNRPVRGTKIFAVVRQSGMIGPYRVEPIDPSDESLYGH